MKKPLLLRDITMFLFISFIVSYTGNGQPKLKVLDENYPKVVFFRSSERTSGYDGYDQWQNVFNKFSGFIGQALPFELSDHELGDLEKNPEYFNRFKKDHPDQIIIIHLNGTAQDPRYLPVDYFAGHWLYYNGAKVLSDIDEDGANAIIKVSDASLFYTNAGFTGDRNEDIGLCALNKDGTPNWNYSEQVQLIAADTMTNTISVRRGLYGTNPMKFKAAETYATSHVWDGPWNKRRYMNWAYNYSTECPKDASGRNFADRYSTYLSDVIAENGLLHGADGYTFDYTYGAPRCTPRFARGRLPDFDGDGVGEDFNKDNSYTIGIIEFFRKLREKIGDKKYIMSDGQDLDNQRAFEILNGIESEGWPVGSDPKINDWSGGLNRFFFWYANAKKPILNYTNFKYFRNVSRNDITQKNARVVMAVAVFTSSIYALNLRPTEVFGYRSEGRGLEVYDELVMGKEKRTGWLGKPMGEMVHLAKYLSKNQANFAPSIGNELLKKLKGEGVRFSIENNSIKIESNKSEIRFVIKDIPVTGKDLTMLISAKGETIKDFPKEYARMYALSAGEKGLPMPDRITPSIKDKNRFASFVNLREFTSDFYFSKLEKNTVDVEMQVESSEPIWITGIEAYSSPDVVCREFENGLVLANPSDEHFELNVKELFPKQKFRRLLATEYQDKITNNGALVGEILRLDGKDALFLVKEKQ